MAKTKKIYIQQERIQLIKVKDIDNQRSIHQKDPPVYTKILSSRTVSNINNNNNTIRVISEGSCDTEDCNNDAENSVLIAGMKYIKLWFTFTFTFMHLADAFIQSDLQCIQVIHLFCQYVCSLGIEPTTFALLTQCSTTEPQEHIWFKIVILLFFTIFNFLDQINAP